MSSKAGGGGGGDAIPCHGTTLSLVSYSMTVRRPSFLTAKEQFPCLKVEPLLCFPSVFLHTPSPLMSACKLSGNLYQLAIISHHDVLCVFRHETEKNQKKRKIAYMWGSAATEPPGGGFGRGVPPPAENFAILGTENHVLNAEKKRRPNLLGVGSGGGFPPPAENFAILGTENHVLMHFRTTFWGYNVDYLLCLVTLQLKMIFFFFFFFFLRMSKSAEIRGSAEKSHAWFSFHSFLDETFAQTMNEVAT